jgi:putative membrane protein
VLGPVLVVSLWAGGVAVAAIWYGKEVGLTNNVGMSTCLSAKRGGSLWVVPLLSVVVALLLGMFPSVSGKFSS